MNSASLPPETARLIAAARAVRAYAYAPYSHFAVGAALRLSDGTIITGSNLENASYGLSLCAEATALATANSAGKLRDIVEIAIVGGAINGPEGMPTPPCGRCRQMLAEAQSVAGRSVTVTCAQPEGAAWASFTVDALLPLAFAGTHLTPTQEES